MADLQNNPQQIVDDASKKLEADPLPPAEPETIVIAPHPKDDQPSAEKPGKPPKKKRGKGMLIGMLLFFILTLPVAIYYGSQKYQQITEGRSRAGVTCTRIPKYGTPLHYPPGCTSTTQYRIDADEICQPEDCFQTSGSANTPIPSKECGGYLEPCCINQPKCDPSYWCSPIDGGLCKPQNTTVPTRTPTLDTGGEAGVVTGSSGGTCPGTGNKLLNECFGGAAGNPGGCGGFGCGANEQRNMQCCYTNGCPTDEEAYICKGPGAKWETRGDCYFDPSCGSPAATNTPAPTNTTAPIATNTPVPTATNAPTATEIPQATATPTERVIYVQQPAERVVYVQQPTSTRVIAEAPITTETLRPTPKVPVSGFFDVKAIIITVGSVLLLALGLIL